MSQAPIFYRVCTGHSFSSYERSFYANDAQWCITLTIYNNKLAVKMTLKLTVT